jgi:hypothetical protein
VRDYTHKGNGINEYFRGDFFMTTLKDCLYKTIHRNKKPLKAIAEEIEMAESYLTRSALPDLEESETGTGCRFPLKKLIPLIHATDDFCTLDFIERSLGRVAVKLPGAKVGALRDVCRLSLRAVSEFGELMREVEKSLADNVIKPAEMERIREECFQTIEALLTLMNTLEKQK